MSDNYFTRASVLSFDRMHQLLRYAPQNGGTVEHLGTFSSRAEAEHAFFRQFPLGILAEGNRHRVQQMPTRGHAREYAKNFPEWQAKDSGKLAGAARWCVVKRAVNSPRPTLTVKKGA